MTLRLHRLLPTLAFMGLASVWSPGACAADALDPRSWSKSPEPVFASSTANSQFGPGHNSFTTTPDGQTDILVYHARNYKEIPGEALSNPDRHTRAQVLGWTDDNRPVFGEPAADGPCNAPSARSPEASAHLSPQKAADSRPLASGKRATP